MTKYNFKNSQKIIYIKNRNHSLQTFFIKNKFFFETVRHYFQVYLSKNTGTNNQAKQLTTMTGFKA
jgi:hypothetical protein